MGDRSEHGRGHRGDEKVDRVWYTRHMWNIESYPVATSTGPKLVTGMTMKGLGMHVVRKHVLFAQSPIYGVTHLGSGHTVCLIEAHDRKASTIFAELVSAGDWEFDGLKGWENMSPDLADKVQAIIKRHESVIRAASGEPDDRIARQVARGRA